jgi:hypothetical protein
MLGGSSSRAAAAAGSRTGQARAAERCTRARTAAQSDCDETTRDVDAGRLSRRLEPRAPSSPCRIRTSLPQHASSRSGRGRRQTRTHDLLHHAVSPIHPTATRDTHIDAHPRATRHDRARQPCTRLASGLPPTHSHTTPYNPYQFYSIIRAGGWGQRERGGQAKSQAPTNPAHDSLCSCRS